MSEYEVFQDNPEPNIDQNDDSMASRQMQGVVTATLKATAACRWQKQDNFFWPAFATTDALPPGFYKPVSTPDKGVVLQLTDVSTDNLVSLPDTIGDMLIDEFKTFWGMRERFTSRGFLHKRGILIWGRPGTGKTATINLMAQELITNQGGVVAHIDHPHMAAIALANFRRIEPTRPIVAVLEDLDASVATHGEQPFLSLLDGETQIDRICYVATTNYPERLDRRFIDRPSRFDTVQEMMLPTRAARSVYLLSKEPSLAGDEIGRWLDRTDRFSVAHLRELIILVRCYGKDLDKSVKRLVDMREKLPNSFKDSHTADSLAQIKSNRGGQPQESFGWDVSPVAPLQPFPG